MNPMTRTRAEAESRARRAGGKRSISTPVTRLETTPHAP